VEYGLTTAYGDSKQSNTKTKEHEIVITDLTPGETYHLRVLGDDGSGNIFASSDITFQPKAPPKISGLKIDAITEHGAVVTFTTNVSTDALVTYANIEDEQDTGFQGRPDFISNHKIELKNLSPGATFSVKVKVTDENGNETEESFPNFTTTKDENPPKIDMVKTDLALAQNDKVQSIISWTTNEPATTTVLYKEGRNAEPKEVEISKALTSNHIAVLTTFKSGTVYFFNVKSIDAAGNEAISSDFALLTPKRKENIIQIIISNFTEIFGWARM
jgi:hypothetical protein